MPANEEKFLPVVYILEIYENTFRNDPSCSALLAGPLQAIQIGDCLANEGLDPQPDVPTGQILKVVGLRHLISTIRSDRVTHSLSVCVKAVLKPAEIFGAGSRRL
jgi:hypothetical protein